MRVPDPDEPICSSGKVPFRTEADALRALGAARWRARQGGTGQRLPGSVEERAVWCGGCDWWHLTSSKGRGRRRSELGNRGRRRR